jgi:hypothetical protein
MISDNLFLNLSFMLTKDHMLSGNYPELINLDN